jgi:hypothetical protein
VRGLKSLILVAVAATAARMAIVWLTEPSPKEAYYFLCAQRPAAAFFDGPSGTALFTRFANEIEPTLAWRLAAPLWALCATFACFALIRQLADTARAVSAALLLNAIPVFNSSALRVGPELPALTFVLLGLLAAWRASRVNSGKLVWWSCAGLCFGAASWFAYAAVAILPGIVCFAFSDPKNRRPADFFGACLLFGIPALCLTPALFWNSEQDWIPIAGGTLRTVWEFQWASFLGSLSSLLLAFSPLLLAAIPLGCFLAFAGRNDDARTRFIFWCGLPGVILGIYFLLRGGSGVLYLLFVSPLLLLKAMDSFSSRPRLATGLRWGAIVLALIFALFAVLEAVQASRGWQQTASEVGYVFLEKAAEGQEDLFLIAEDPGLASVLGYHLRKDFIAPAGHPTVYVRESQDISNQFAFWPSYADFTETGKVSDEYFTEQEAENAFLGRSALYITHERAEDLPQAIEGAFDSVSVFRELPGAGDDLRPLYIYLCVNYQTLPL